VSTLTEIEAAIASLPTPEFRELLQKLNARDAGAWDRQIEDDAQNGNLDRLYSRLKKEDGDQPKVALDEEVNNKGSALFPMGERPENRLARRHSAAAPQPN